MVLTREGKQNVTNPFSKIAEVIEQDHKKIEEHSVASLKEVLTTDIEHYGFDNKNISDHDVNLLLRLVGNIIKVKCRQVYRDEI
jgi:translation initiation factor 2 beta subunit (eIF-2beta)/eIF-5